MSKPQKILYYVQNDWFLVSHRLPILREARKQGYSIHIACRVSTHYDSLVAEGFHVYPLKYLGAQRINPVQELFTLFEIMLLIFKIRPDIIHNISIRPVLHGSLAARFMRVPFSVNAITGVGFIFMTTGKKALYIQRFVSSALEFGLGKKGTHLIFQNNDDIELFKKYRIIKKDTPLNLLHGSGVDLEVFKPNTKKQDPPAIIFGARLLKDKGIGELVKAAFILNKRNISFKLLIAGDPDLGNPTAIRPEKIESWRTYPFIEVLGYRNDMDKLLGEASIACLPSYREGLPKFLADAAAAGLPIVTTDTPGCREVVDEGKNGFMVPVGNFNELANVLEKLLNDSELQKRMGQESRKKAEKLFNIHDIVEKTVNIYNSFSD